MNWRSFYLATQLAVLVSTSALGADKPLVLPAANPAAAGLVTYADLTTAERAAFMAAARKVKGDANLTVVCGGEWCRALANDVAQVFGAAGNWNVARINHPGLGVDGVVGLRVVVCKGDPKAVAEAIKAATPRQVEVIEDVCPVSSEQARALQVFLVIGKPI